MKSLKIFANAALCMALSLTIGCTKSEVEQPASNLSRLQLSIVPATKASGSEHGVQSNDNIVQTLEIFIFRAEGADAGSLDTYKKFTSEQLTDLSNLQINTTVGLKQIYAVANSHRDNWEGILTQAQFEACYAELQKENLKSFTMTGGVQATLQSATSLTFSISRLVARVGVSSIKTTFAGTPYSGSHLQNVKVYLTNAHSQKYFANGASIEGVKILNSKMAVEEDINNCQMLNMLYEQIVGNIADAGYNTPHYFYTYANPVAAQTEQERFTKLVIQADLNGNTYYYPISIENIERNKAYSIAVNITRPGVLDPEQELESGVLTATINVLDWVLHPQLDVEF